MKPTEGIFTNKIETWTGDWRIAYHQLAALVCTVCTVHTAQLAHTSIVRQSSESLHTFLKRQLLSCELKDKIAEPNEFFISLTTAHQPTICLHECLVQFICSMWIFLVLEKKNAKNGMCVYCAPIASAINVANVIQTIRTHTNSRCSFRFYFFQC